MPEQITQDIFLQRIREALKRDRPMPSPEPPVVDRDRVRLMPHEGDLLERFERNLLYLDGEVRRCTAASLVPTLVRLLGELQAKRVTINLDRLLHGEAVECAVREAGVDVLEWRHDPTLAAHYEADAGIGDVHAALAETGTLICATDAAHGRGVSLVPPVHIALVRRSDVLADMIDYFDGADAVSPANASSSVVMISGPSKTADIEGVLVKGVHGPSRVIAILIEDA